jgi:hypothetical protein
MRKLYNLITSLISKSEQPTDLQPKGFKSVYPQGSKENQFKTVITN